MGVDSGLPDFRGPQASPSPLALALEAAKLNSHARTSQGFWKAYPQAQALGLSFSDMSNPRSFVKDPRFGWGFFGHRYQLYRDAVPHEGYHVLRRWGGAARLGSFTFTSNVDGAFLAAGFDEEKLVECHGSIHYLQAFDARLCGDIWPSAPQLDKLVVDKATFLADEATLPYHTVPSSDTPILCRPNILMFGDGGWISDRTDAQEARFERYVQSLPRDSRVVVIEIGAGLAVPTVRHTSESLLDMFSNAQLLRINPAEPQGPERTISIPEGGLAALTALDAALGGAAGIGSARGS